MMIDDQITLLVRRLGTYFIFTSYTLDYTHIVPKYQRRKLFQIMGGEQKYSIPTYKKKIFAVISCI